MCYHILNKYISTQLFLIGGLLMDIKNIKRIDVHAHATLFPEYYPPSKETDPNSVFISAEQLIDFYDRLGIEKGI